MKNQPHFQHYLPESYLNGFANKKGLVWVYDKKENVFKELPPKVFGGENHLYSIKKGPGKFDTTVEDGLRDVDGMYMTILRKLQNNEQLDHEDRGNLSLILALFMTRTPHFKNWVEEGSIQSMKMIMKISASHKESYYQKLKNLGVPESQWEETRLSALEDDYDIVPARGYSLEMMIKLALDIAPLLYSFEWFVGIASSTTSFITTDNPVALIPTDGQQYDKFWGIGLLTPGITIHFPLDKERMLGMRFTEKPTEFITYGKITDRSAIRKINHDLFLYTDRYAVARDEAWIKRIEELTRNRNNEK